MTDAIDARARPLTLLNVEWSSPQQIVLEALAVRKVDESVADYCIRLEESAEIYLKELSLQRLLAQQTKARKENIELLDIYADAIRYYIHLWHFTNQPEHCGFIGERGGIDLYKTDIGIVDPAFASECMAYCNKARLIPPSPILAWVCAGFERYETSRSNEPLESCLGLTSNSGPRKISIRKTAGRKLRYALQMLGYMRAGEKSKIKAARLVCAAEEEARAKCPEDFYGQPVSTPEELRRDFDKLFGNGWPVIAYDAKQGKD